MKTAKIQEIVKVNEWNKGPHGTLYYIYMKLDNGETINLGKKKADAFKVGDTVSYNTIEEGKKYEEVKENTYEKKSYNADNGRGAFLGMAIKIAFEKVYDPKEENYAETWALAGRIYEDAINLFNNSGTEEESTKNDSLPF